MRRVQLDASWPESWKVSYRYDLLEVYGEGMKFGFTRAYLNRQKHTLEALHRFVPRGGRILDIAAAQGNFSLLLAEDGYLITWNDLRADLAEYVEMKREFGSIVYAPGDVFDLQFAQPFDAVLITEIIEHVAHPDRFLAQVAQLVKPGGHIVMTTPNGAYFRNTLPKFSDCPNPEQFEAVQFKPNSDGHIFLLHPEEIKTLISNLDVVLRELELFTNPLSNGHVKTEVLLHLLPKVVVDKIESVTTLLPYWIRRRLSVQMIAVFERVA